MLKYITLKINNLKFRDKMILIYLLCTIIPILWMNIYHYTTIKGKMENQKLNDMEYSLGIAKEAIRNYIYQSISFTDRIYFDKNIYDMLAIKYTGYKLRQDLVNHVDIMLDYSSLGRMFESVYVYTDNPTLIEMGKLRVINDSVKESVWYKKHEEGGLNLSIITYPDNNPETSSNGVSIIRNMNFHGSIKTDWFIKVDISSNAFKNILKEQNTMEKVFLLDADDNIICYFDADNTRVAEFAPPLDTDRRFLSVQKSIDLGNGWKLIGFSDKGNMDIGLYGNMKIFVFMIIFQILYSLLFIWFIARSFVTRLDILKKTMKKIEHHQFETIDDALPGNDEVGLLIHGVNDAVTMIKTLIQDVYEARLRQTEIELEKRRAELDSLQSQINPHFIFNVLESIRMKSVIKGETETATMIKYLSRMFRRFVRHGDDLIMLCDEMEFIHQYLEIEKYRFGEELTVNTSITPPALDCFIPKMILQVLIENACIHGIEGISGKKTIDISIWEEKGFIYCTVIDNGKGFSFDMDTFADNKEDSTGIKNILRRLELYYGKKYKFGIKSKENIGTTVEFSIPARKEK